MYRLRIEIDEVDGEDGVVEAIALGEFKSLKRAVLYATELSELKDLEQLRCDSNELDGIEKMAERYGWGGEDTVEWLEGRLKDGAQSRATKTRDHLMLFMARLLVDILKERSDPRLEELKRAAKDVVAL